MVGRAALNADGQDATYFFEGDRYVKITWWPDQGGDTIRYGPTKIFNEWHTLKEIGFNQIDAILPIPGDTNTAYFFSGSKYVRLKFTPSSSKEELLGSVRSTTANWRSLAKAGFDRVDAAIPVPGTTNQAYFFSGREFCRVSFREGVASPDELLDGPHMIRDRWEGLGVNTIDTIFPSPTSHKHAYFFSGSQAGRLAFVSGGNVELDVGLLDAADYWPSLHQAGFY
ncbi:hypothetical protein FRC08_002343 [Ceratobasidium sp. 394]|nr:hypothetical protein FRC08_002343 [Ceratobasidium sp. 394]KAG9092460.1 hypothetical protein FS749_015738 [Ceratobasidium sp. UAMH 11750]